MEACFFVVAVAPVALVVWWWLRNMRWKRGPDQENPSWEAARQFETKRRQRLEAGQIDDVERLRVEVARLEDENRDLRAMLPTDDYRTVSRRGAP